MDISLSNTPATPEDDVLRQFLRTLSVLYVEDNADIREQLTLFLQRRFGEVLVAQDGAEGLRLFEQGRTPDLVITDVRMPAMDGLTMTGHLRERWGDIPIMVTTAHEETEFLLKAIEIGVDEFVVKPVDTRQMNRALLKIGAHLHACHALAQAQRTLEANEARYRAIFWTAMDAFCVFDWESLNILEINRRHQTLYSHSAEDISGQNIDILFDNVHGTQLRQLIADTASLQEPMIVRHRHSDGTMFPVEMTIGQFNTEDQRCGLMVTRDARERLDNIEEQDSVVDALEITIDALEGMLER
ncbi:response regulator [Natronospirillum operosum]|nr:response regulator [Natronospirillum operosum]